MKINNFLACFVLALLLVACKKDKEDVPVSTQLEAETRLDASYISSSSSRAHMMDIYLPAGRSTEKTKVLIMMHGGAWAAGDKSDFSDYITEIQQLMPDYAIFNINYRLYVPGNEFPAQENDVKAAVEYIYNNRNSFHVSDKFVLMGASAGAHLAMLQAYKNNTLVKPKAVIDFFGPTDMTALYSFYESVPDIITLFGLNALLNGSPSTNPQMYTNSSPLNFVTAQSPPTIILQGGADATVPKQQSLALQSKLNELKVKNEWVYYENLGHGGWPEKEMSESLAKIKVFLNANLP